MISLKYDNFRFYRAVVTEIFSLNSLLYIIVLGLCLVCDI